MQTVQITSTISFDELLNSVNQLSLPDLEHFVSRTLALLARRKAPSLPKKRVSRKQRQMVAERAHGPSSPKYVFRLVQS